MKTQNVNKNELKIFKTIDKHAGLVVNTKSISFLVQVLMQ